MFCPRCGEKNPGYVLCCPKCGLALTEVQKILEMQTENKPILASFDETIGFGNGNNAAAIPAGTVSEGPAAISQEPGQEENVVTSAEYLTAVQFKDRGNECFKAGKFLDAIDCYEKAIAIDQFYKDAWYNKSIALKKIDREDQAKVCWGIYRRLEALEKKGD
jgi:tetratricopeptide (TPR) repeat protein